ncbi:MAG: hypothetical protein GXP26_06045 [Planctomycetes bacterium]|nr:hypothetical protein [Planctomycetota bacterium]
MDKNFSLTAVLLALLASLLLHANASAQALPDSLGQSMLIKNTIVAVNHGNLTGNYTVLRDLASERFQKKNTASDLAATFTNLRKKKMDLSPILVTEPQLTQHPAEDKFRGRLQLIGYFPTQPQAVQFNLIFQHVKGGWMIDEISVAIAPVKPVAPK